MLLAHCFFLSRAKIFVKPAIKTPDKYWHTLGFCISLTRLNLYQCIHNINDSNQDCSFCQWQCETEMKTFFDVGFYLDFSFMLSCKLLFVKRISCA